MKNSNLYLDRQHCKEVNEILFQFRKKVTDDKQAGNKNTYIKNLTLYTNNNSYEVFNTLKNNFLKEL